MITIIKPSQKKDVGILFICATNAISVIVLMASVNSVKTTHELQVSYRNQQTTLTFIQFAGL